MFSFVIPACDLVRGGAGAGFKTGAIEDRGVISDEDCVR
jgi:hypothetical protein